MGAFERISSFVDAAIGVLSPEAYQKRMQYRTAALHQKRFYDGATKGRRAESWRKADSAEREPYSQLLLLRQRSRDFSRNNGYAKKAVGAIVANSVGTGIVLQYKNGPTRKKEEKANLAWRRWHDTTQIDFNGKLTGNAMQALCFRTMVEAGEVFIRKRVISSKDSKAKNTFPLKLQILEAEFLDESKNSANGALGSKTINGIEYDADDVRTGYYFYRTHPGDRASNESVLVPADEVIHLYREDRPGQQRGASWGSAAMLNLRDLDDYEDSELTRRKIAACFAGFVTRPEVERQVQVNGAGEPIPLPPLVDRLEPGIMEQLEPGEQVTFSTPPNVTGYQEYVTAILHKISAAYEVPYSVLTGDFSLVNFSSGRMGWLEFQRVIEQWRWNLFIPIMMDRVRAWFEEIGSLQGYALKGLAAEWTAPRREMIDPLKEISAKVMQVKAGLMTMQEAIKEMGYEPEDNIDGFVAWNKLLDENKIILDSDPRQDPKRLMAQNVADAAKIKDTIDKQSENKNVA